MLRVRIAGLILALSTPALADPAPPLPTPAVRAALIAEHGGLDYTPRAIHDDYDVLHYDIDLSLDITTHVLTGAVEVTATPLVTDLTEIDLDLYACMAIDAVTAGGAPTTHSWADDVLTIALDGTYQPSETFTVACGYHGTPYQPGMSLPFRWSQHLGVPMVLTYSEPYGAPAWWLCKDDPKDKATFAIHLTVPDSLIAVSNGLLTSEVDNGNGTKTFNWTTDYPMSTYLFSIAVTNFASWTEVYTALDQVTTMDVDYYAYPEDLADAQVDWHRNIEMMEFYASIFGEYPFLTEKYGIAEFAHPGAMEHQTCTSMGAGWITGNNSNEFVVAHELAHSWVGDAVTMTTWSHAWCKEGYATYCEALWFEHRYGVPYYHSYMRGMGVHNYDHYQLYNIDPPLHGAIYYKGAWVLHMLRHVIGDPAFFEACYAYVNDPAVRYGVADTDDLRAYFEAASGMDLVWFFDEWIYNPGSPVYEEYWWSTPSRDGYDVSLRLKQTQTIGPIFTMPIDIRIETPQGDETFVVWDSLATQTFTFHVDAEPYDLDVDPDQWIIRQITEMSDVPESAAAEPCFARTAPNPSVQTTAFSYSLAEAGHLTIAIHDPTGRRIVSLFDDNQPGGTGQVEWDGRDAAGRRVAPGVYFCRLQIGGYVASRHVLLLR